MEKSKLFAIISGVIVLVVGVFVVTFLLIKFLWAWTIPDLFPGAVKEGLVAKEIGWLTSFKLALFFAVMTGISKSNNK